jgi:hypothetical protein
MYIPDVKHEALKEPVPAPQQDVKIPFQKRAFYGPISTNTWLCLYELLPSRLKYSAVSSQLKELARMSYSLAETHFDTFTKT